MTVDLIPLADAIAVLRSQLAEARNQGQDEELQFEVGPVEVEFQVVLDRSVETGAKMGFSLFGLGSEASIGGKLGDSRTHSIKFTLTPRYDDEPFNIAAKRSKPSRLSGPALGENSAGKAGDASAARR